LLSFLIKICLNSAKQTEDPNFTYALLQLQTTECSSLAFFSTLQTKYPPMYRNDSTGRNSNLQKPP